MLDRLLGGICPPTGAPMPPRAKYQLTAGVEVVDFATPQSVALFGQPASRIRIPTIFAAYVLNEAVGGGNFSSRLMDEVREKRGLTYGIGTYLVPTRPRRLFRRPVRLGQWQDGRGAGGGAAGLGQYRGKRA